MLKYLSLFSGIGAFESALTNLGVNYEVVNYCEIDKYASNSYSAIHGIPETKNLWDITKVNVFNLPKPNTIDLITYGFPFQDISLAGNQKGLFNEDGTLTRSGLFFEALKVIEYCKPKVAIAENVKNLTSKKFATQFETVLKSLEEAGYNNYWKVLNSKDYGIPQNRERVFIVSIRKDVDNELFEFPKPYSLEKRLKDFLEPHVDEKYYLSGSINHRAINENGISGTLCVKDYTDHKCVVIEPKRLGGIFDTKTSKHQAGSIYDKEFIAPTIDTMQGGYRQPMVVVSEPINTMPDGTCRTLKNQYFKTSKANFERTSTFGATGVSDGLRIRKLTPKECYRLMGFSDEEFERAENVPTSNTQLYKQAGNSVVVDVLEELFCMLLDEKGDFYL